MQGWAGHPLMYIPPLPKRVSTGLVQRLSAWDRGYPKEQPGVLCHLMPTFLCNCRKKATHTQIHSTLYVTGFRLPQYRASHCSSAPVPEDGPGSTGEWGVPARKARSTFQHLNGDQQVASAGALVLSVIQGGNADSPAPPFYSRETGDLQAGKW